MADDNIKIVVGAEDKASKVILDAAKNAEAAMKKVEQQEKQLAQATKKRFTDTKASTEFFGTIANLAGGSAIASFAGQVANLTEKTSQFSEVAKQGTAATMAFQGGLVLAGGAIASQIGTAIHNLTSDLADTVEGMKRLESEADRLQQRANNRLRQDLKDRQTRIEIIGDEADVKKEIDRINKEIDKSTEKQAQLRTTADVAAEAARGRRSLLSSAIDYVSGGHEAARLKQESDQREREIARERERQQILQDQRSELQRHIGVEKELNELRDKKNKEKEGESPKEQINTTKALIDARTPLLDSLQEEIVRLEKGTEAARAFRLQKQGLSEVDAEAIAQAESMLSQLKGGKDQTAKSGGATPELQALESRLLTRRPGGDSPESKTAENTKKQAELTQQSNNILEQVKSVLQQLLAKDGGGVKVEVIQ
jgi:DNA repair exonuclease SbcCD ATPase subunit